MARRNGWQLAFGLAAAIALVLATGCDPAGSSLVVEHKTTTAARLNPDGSDTYDFTSTPRGMIIGAPSGNTGATLRMVGFKKASPSAVDQESCATWSAGTAGRTQPGVALRIDATPSRVRAITITNNVLHDVRWMFNIHLGDSAGRPGWFARPPPCRGAPHLHGPRHPHPARLLTPATLKARRG